MENTRPALLPKNRRRIKYKQQYTKHKSFSGKFDWHNVATLMLLYNGNTTVVILIRNPL